MSLFFGSARSLPESTELLKLREKFVINLSAILPHYLLRVNATEVILANDRDDQCAPSWVFRELGKTSLVVVRRGAVTRDRIPVGIRGPERSQRWAALCPPSAIQQIIT